MPAVERLSKSSEPGCVNREAAGSIDQGCAHAHGRAGKTVTGAVDGDGVLCAGGFGDFFGRFSPVFPGCAFTRHIHASLVEQGLVDVRTGHGESIRVAAVAEGFQDGGREVGCIVG